MKNLITKIKYAVYKDEMWSLQKWGVQFAEIKYAITEVKHVTAQTRYAISKSLKFSAKSGLRESGFLRESRPKTR